MYNFKHHNTRKNVSKRIDMVEINSRTRSILKFSLTPNAWKSLCAYTEVKQIDKSLTSTSSKK